MTTIKKFTWQGINQQGYKTQGELTAADANTVKTLLVQQGITATQIKRVVNFTSKKINAIAIHEFTQELGALIKAGIPLTTALQILAHSAQEVAVKTMLAELQQHIQSGKQFSEALSLQKHYFNDIYCHLIHAGEQAGKLDSMLHQLTQYQKKALLLKQQIKKALFYPSIVLVLAFVISMIMIAFIIPRFSALFASFNAQLPALTLLVIKIAKIIQRYSVVIGVFIIFTCVVYRYLIKRFIHCRYWHDAITLRLPLIRTILKTIILARSFRTLATLLTAGLPVLDALKTTANSAHNFIYYDYFKAAQQIVNNGQPLHTAFKQSHLFPPRVNKIIALGEESGNLDTMLLQLADYFENKVDDLVARFAQWLEPMIMLILCIIVGGFIIAMYLPIFRLSAVI